MSVVDKSELRKVTVHELYELACQCRESIWYQASQYNREPKVYLHWSAGHYGQFFDDYHIQIDADGSIYVYGDLDEVLNHTWKRNTGSVGIGLSCCAFATSEDLGDEPPTNDQIEAMAQAIVAVCEGLWLTIDKNHVLTHAEAADNYDEWIHEAYGATTTVERWDLQFLGTPESPYFVKNYESPYNGGNVLRGKALWYKNTGNW